MLWAALACPALAEVPNSFDVFNQQSLNANGSEAETPTSFSQEFSRQYDTVAYTWDPGQPDNELSRVGCIGGDGAHFGSRTAWVRFTPAVRGRLSVSASTGYDVMLFAYSTTLPRGAKGFNADQLVTLTCSDASTGGGELPMIIPSSAVVPGETILIATASFCGTSEAACKADPKSGGDTALTVRFTADDGDGDGVPDTADGCPATKGEAPGGCPPPDTDGDAIPDRDDTCPQQTGVAPTGCPADVDGDGVANEQDKCLFQFGTNPDGCPDPDNDGVVNRDDLCPFTVGIRSDGCPDTDGDGVSDRADKCRTTPGNGPDGCPQPLEARFPDRWLGFPNATKVLMLGVTAPKGATVRLTCKGKGCKVKRARFTLKRKHQSLLRYLPRNRMLRKGTVLELRVTAPRTLGTYVRFRIRGLALPKRTDRCISPSGRLRKCP